MIIYKYATILIPYIDLFLYLCGEWSSFVFKDFQKYFFKPNLLILPTLSVEYFDQLLGAAHQVHVLYLAQLLGAVLFIHIMSNHDTLISIHDKWY